MEKCITLEYFALDIRVQLTSFISVIMDSNLLRYNFLLLLCKKPCSEVNVDCLESFELKQNI